MGAMNRPDMGEGTWAFHVALDRYATTLTSLRSEDIDFITGYVSGGTVVPIEALTSKYGGVTGVYLFGLAGSGSRKSRSLVQMGPKPWSLA